MSEFSPSSSSLGCLILPTLCLSGKSRVSHHRSYPCFPAGEGSWSREGGPSSNTREAALEEPNIALPPAEKVPRKAIRREEPAYGSVQLG